MKGTQGVIPVLVILCTLIQLAYSTCYANPGVRNPESVGIQTLATCCWLHEDTCCALNGVAANLTDIQESLKQLVLNGIDEECYISLANLECIVCDPTQTISMQPQGIVEGGKESNLEDQIFTLRICSTLAKQIFSACNDASSIAALGATATTSYIEFVESINGTFLTANKGEVSSVFYSAEFLVTDFDCYYGVFPTIIENDVGVCLSTYNDCLIPDEEPSFSDYTTRSNNTNFANSSSSSSLFPSLLFISSFLLSFVLLM